MATCSESAASGCWQRRLEPLNRRLAGGCHLTRPILDLLEAAGFSVEHVDAFHEAGAPRWQRQRLPVEPGLLNGDR